MQVVETLQQIHFVSPYWTFVLPIIGAGLDCVTGWIQATVNGTWDSTKMKKGLHSNQKLVFENCDFIRRTSAKYHNDQYQYYTNYNGAMIIHDATRAEDSENQSLDIIGCRFLCNLGKAATISFRYGNPANVKYAMVGNSFWSDSDGAAIVATTGEAVLLGYSHGNNISDFNA